MRKSIVLFFAACMAGSQLLWAGAPWGEVLPKGRTWLLFYYVGQWASESYDNSGNKAPLISGLEGEGSESHEIVEYAYGITDDLSAGVIIPYSSRNVTFKSPVYPKQEGSGIGDIKVGGQYRYYKKDALASTFRLTTKLPTGAVDDPKNSKDIEIGTGQAYVEFTNFIDYFLDNKNWVLSGMARFNWQLEGKYDTLASRISAMGSTYKKDPGDDFWLAAGIERKNIVTPGLSASMRVEQRWDSQDNYTSNSAFYDSAYEANTAGELLFIQPEVKYSAFKTYKLPLRLYANYRIPVQGKNNIVMNRLEIGMDIFF